MTNQNDYPAYPCPDDPDGLHSIGCGCEFYGGDDFDDAGFHEQLRELMNDAPGG